MNIYFERSGIETTSMSRRNNYPITNTNYSLCPKLLIMFRKSNFSREHFLVCCLFHNNVQVFKITLLNLKSSEDINFLNKARDKLINKFMDFSKRTIFWDIPKWNRGLTIWDGWRVSSPNTCLDLIASRDKIISKKIKINNNSPI